MLQMMFLLLGILSVLYGICVRSLRSGTGFYFFWILLGMVFFLLALLIRKNIFRKLPGILKISGGALLLLAVLAFLAFEGLALSHFQDQGEKNADYLLVLGAQVRESGPSRVLQYRLDAAIDYLKENPNTKCIVSGGQGANEPCSEAEGMAKYLMQQGIEESRICMEDKSLSTLENMTFSQKFLKEGDKVCIVTNNFHLFRALQMAKRAGIKNISGIAAGSTSFFLPNNMVREFLGELKYLLSE